jgi:hypothetical protein
MIVFCQESIKMVKGKEAKWPCTTMPIYVLLSTDALRRRRNVDEMFTHKIQVSSLNLRAQIISTNYQFYPQLFDTISRPRS